MPLYVLDGNGESHIVAVWLITSEDAANIRAMTEIFQQYNEEWCKTVTIMADKDFTERNIFLQQFPQANLLICLFHVLKTFRREITSERVGITSAERYMVLEIVQRMAYSTNEEMYMKCYKELEETKLTKVIEYFNSNWHEIREQWVNGLKDDSLTYQNRTNNRVESINQKLKSVISKFSWLPQFCTELVGVLSVLQTERNHRAISLFQKVPVKPFSLDSVEHQYMDILTPYTLSFVVHQIKLADKVKIKSEVEGSFEIESTTQCSVTATCFECNCSFRKTMQLPCRHIFAIRRRCEIPMFDPNLCAVRWTLQYYKSSNRVLCDNDRSDNGNVESSVKRLQGFGNVGAISVWMNIVGKVSNNHTEKVVAPYYVYLIDDPVVGEYESDTSDTVLDSESGMESLSMPLPMKESPSPEDRVDIHREDHLVQSMLLVFYHYKLDIYVCVCVYVATTETGMESLSTPLPMEEVPSPEDTVDIQSDQLQVQSMLHVFCIAYCI